MTVGKTDPSGSPTSVAAKSATATRTTSGAASVALVTIGSSVNVSRRPVALSSAGTLVPRPRRAESALPHAAPPSRAAIPTASARLGCPR